MAGAYTTYFLVRSLSMHSKAPKATKTNKHIPETTAAAAACAQRHRRPLKPQKPPAPGHHQHSVARALTAYFLARPLSTRSKASKATKANKHTTETTTAAAAAATSTTEQQQQHHQDDIISTVWVKGTHRVLLGQVPQHVLGGFKGYSTLGEIHRAVALQERQHTAEAVGRVHVVQEEVHHWEQPRAVRDVRGQLGDDRDDLVSGVLALHLQVVLCEQRLLVGWLLWPRRYRDVVTFNVWNGVQWSEIRYCTQWCWSLSCSVILRSQADSLHSPVILHEWLAFYSMFLTIHWRGVLHACITDATRNCCHLGTFCVLHTTMYHVTCKAMYIRYRRV